MAERVRPYPPLWHPAHLEAQGSSAVAVLAVVRAHGCKARHIDHSPETHPRVASAGVADPRTLLTPVEPRVRFTRWPRVRLASASPDLVRKEPCA
jgi:hypothetical protein